jgi:hypothetical protein
LPLEPTPNSKPCFLYVIPNEPNPNKQAFKNYYLNISLDKENVKILE